VFPGSLGAFDAITAGQNSVTVDAATGSVGLQGYTVVSATNANVTIPSFPRGTYNPVTATFTIPNPGQPVDFTLRASARQSAVLIRAQCTGLPPTPTPTPTGTPVPTPTPPVPGVCTPTLTVTEVFPGSNGGFDAVTAGPGSVTVDASTAGVGLQALGVTNAVNANVTVPSFPPGTYSPVTVTFTRSNPSQPMDFTLRAYARRQAIDIRARCAPVASGTERLPLNLSARTNIPFWMPTQNAPVMDALLSLAFSLASSTETARN